MKLGTLLLRNATIGLTQLEAALRNQVLYGGRLGTNLVELGFLDLETLSTYLAEMAGVPVATPTQLDTADRALLDAIGGDDAHRLRALPLATDHASGAVVVAMVDPSDGDAILQLQTKLGKRVLPCVVPELRALYYLEKHFGLPRRARFIRTARPSEPDIESERRRSQPAAGMVMPPAVTLEPRRRRASSQQAMLTPAVPTALSYGAACERIDTAGDREQIGEALVDYARGRFDALVVFLIRDGNAMGWRGYVAAPTAPGSPAAAADHAIHVASQVEGLSLPLGGASSLQSAHDAGQPFIGRPPAGARPVEAKLWAAVNAGPPAPAPVEVVVVPVLVKQRAVNLVYAHVVGGAPAREHITELVDLTARASQSYVRLIRQARGGP